MSARVTAFHAEQAGTILKSRLFTTQTRPLQEAGCGIDRLHKACHRMLRAWGALASIFNPARQYLGLPLTFIATNTFVSLAATRKAFITLQDIQVWESLVPPRERPSGSTCFSRFPRPPSTHLRSFMTSANPSNAGASLSEKKKNLRKSITARLRALDDSYVAAEVSRLFPRLLALEDYKDSTCVSLYLSMPAKEVPTFPNLLEIVMTGGKRAEGRARDVYVPKVGKTSSLKSFPDLPCLRINAFLPPYFPLSLLPFLLPGHRPCSWRYGHASPFFSQRRELLPSLQMGHP